MDRVATMSTCKFKRDRQHTCTLCTLKRPIRAISICLKNDEQFVFKTFQLKVFWFILSLKIKKNNAKYVFLIFFFKTLQLVFSGSMFIFKQHDLKQDLCTHYYANVLRLYLFFSSKTLNNLRDTTPVISCIKLYC